MNQVTKNGFRRKGSKRRQPAHRRALTLEGLEDRALMAIATLTPSKDNTLYQYKAGTVSSGAGTSVAVGEDHFTLSDMRGLMAFDLAGSVPAGSTINSAKLTVWVNLTASTTNVNQSVELHKTLANWGEGASAPSGFMPTYGAAKANDATWLHTFYSTQFWTNPGGDFASAASGTTVLGADGTYATWNSTSQMVADVQGWLNNPSTNFGWLLKGDETQESGKMIDSRESSTVAHRPTLVIDYTPPAATPSLTIADAIVTEGNAGTVNAQFNVQLSAASAQTVTVNFTTANSTATSGSDYQLSSGSLTFAPGETLKTIVVPVTGDAVVESNETFNVNLSAATNATIADGLGLGTITNDDSASLTIDDVTLAEGNSGTTNATFTVTLSAAVDAAVGVNFATANDTATTTGGDYTSASGSLTFNGNAGEMKTITVVISGDPKVELNEKFLVNLSSLTASGRAVTLADAQGQGNITNDDSASLTIDDVTLAEGNSGTTNATFTVTLSAAVDAAVGVNFATANDTATTTGGDYTSASGSLTFTGNAGETKTITVAINGDPTVEVDETFLVNLFNLAAGGRNVSLADAQGLGTIANDDGPALPKITIGDATLAEGNANTSNMSFDVRLSVASSDVVTVDFATSNGSALAGGDYQTTTGTVTFAPGETLQTISIPVVGDSVVELNESFSILLSAPTIATVLDGQGQGTITNDDSATLVISDVTLAEGNTGTTNATLTVTLSAAVDAPVSMQFATANGTATTAANDYTANSGTLAFVGNAGETKTITIVVQGDQKVELDESLLVNLSNVLAAGRAVTMADGQGQVTINNDDNATLAIGDVTLAEGNAGTTNATFTVTLGAAVDAPVSVQFATANGTAMVAANDYTANSGTLAFVGNAGETKTITVAVKGDKTVEVDETFLVNLSSLVAGGRSVTLAAGQAMGTIVNDDIASLSISDVTIIEGNSGTTNATFTVTLSSPVDGPVSVDYASADGTALASSDYQPTSSTLTFSPNETTKTITVLVSGDQLVEPAETLLVNLSNASGASISDGQAVGTIVNDDGTATAYLTDGILHILGTDQNDRVSITATRGELRIDANFLGQSKPSRFPLSAVQRIDISLAGGNDVASVNSKVQIPVLMDGGAGNDSLTGGPKADILLGGDGNDKLFGGDGNDLLIGGRQSDGIYGGMGNDLLIPGTTAFDDNSAALLSILAEWNALRNYDLRVRHLSGDPAALGDARLNGDNFLKVGSDQPTVFDDHVQNEIFGRGGRDWIFPQVDSDGHGEDDDQRAASTKPRAVRSVRSRLR